MSAEGLLRCPCLFLIHKHLRGDDNCQLACSTPLEIAHRVHEHADDDFFECRRCNDICRETNQPDLYTLFEEYCGLSEQYDELGGWRGMDEYEMQKRNESRQIYIARQHLVWMLGKSGHGRSVRYKHLGPSYKRQSDLFNDINSAVCLNGLLAIAKRCLVGKWA